MKSNLRGQSVPASGRSALIGAVAAVCGAAAGLGAATAAPFNVDFNFQYRDSANASFASRLARVELLDQDGGGPRPIGVNGTAGPFPALFTDLSGAMSGMIDHTAAAGEANGFDVFARIRSEAQVGMRNAQVYSSSGNFAPDPDGREIPGTMYHFDSPIFVNTVAAFGAPKMVNTGNNNTNTLKAFSVLDTLVTGMRFAEHLGAPNTFTDVIFPTTTGADSTAVYHQVDSVGGTPEYRMILGSNDAWDWDVILHEYGHVVADSSKFAAKAGGMHSLQGLTADSAAGRQLSWSEGYANFFQAAAQDWENGEAGAGRLPNVSTAKPATGLIRNLVTAYHDETPGATPGRGLTYDIEENKGQVRNRNTAANLGRPTGERSETAVSRIVWDLVDGTGGTEGKADEVTLGNKKVYDLMKTVVNPAAAAADQRGPQNLAEFRKVVQDFGATPGQKNELMEIFAQQEAAPVAVKGKKGGAAPLEAPADYIPNTGGLIGAHPSNREGRSASASSAPSQDGSAARGLATFPARDLTVVSISAENPGFTFEWMGLDGLDTWSVQMFVDSALTIPALDGSSDASSAGDRVIPAFDLIHAASWTNLTGMEASADLGDHAATITGSDSLTLIAGGATTWSSFLSSIAGTVEAPTMLTWNIIGYGTDAATSEGVWGTSLRLAVVPTPGTLALMFAAGIAAIRRRRALGA